MVGLDQSLGLTISEPIGFYQITLPRGFKKSEIFNAMFQGIEFSPSIYKYFVLLHVTSLLGAIEQIII